MLDFFKDWGFLLKLLSGLASAAFGMMGVGAETRDKTSNKLTRKGWIALTGVIVSGLIGIVTAVYEHHAEDAKAQREKLRNEQLILSVRRGIYPLRGITAAFDLDFDQDIPGFDNYKHRLFNVVGKSKSCDHTTGFRCWAFDDKGQVYQYRIPSSSPLFPKPRTLLRDVLDNLGIQFLMLKRLPPEENKGQLRYKQLG